MLDSSNDNSRTGAADGSEGRAALLLAESLVHGLIARSVISVADAVEILDTASEVEADQLVDSASEKQSALTRLAAIRISLARDLDLR